MRTSIITAVLTLTLCAATGLAGCETVRGSPGPDGTSFSLGTLEGMLPGTPQKIVQAIESVFQDMDLHVVSSAASGVDGKVVTRTALDKTIEVEVERKDDETSKVSIRVGTFGDRQMSRDLFARIKAKL